MASEPDNMYVDPNMVELTNAPEDIVRAVLIALCQDSKQEQKAIAYLRKLQRLKSEQLRRDESSATGSMGSRADTAIPHRSNGISHDDSITGGQPNRKRAASDIRICEECQEAFSVDDNPSDACQYHPGSLEMNDDSSVWDDWEDWRSGDRFSKETEEEYPEGFTLDCCNQRGDSDGCAWKSHSAQDKKPYRGGAERPTGRDIPVIIID
ncbi:hypothetical protein F4782DRAFT_104050 [Xylaria castorea]|nr:hypothetical protein F4782DRAFT_104050 [Xylaria castorea]